jgi:hypothetical protein
MACVFERQLIVFYTKEMGFYKMYMLVQFLLASFLAILQLLWGSIVLKGIVKMFLPSSGAKKQTKKE